MQHIFSRPLRCKVVLVSSRRCRKWSSPGCPRNTMDPIHWYFRYSDLICCKEVLRLELDKGLLIFCCPNCLHRNPRDKWAVLKTGLIFHDTHMVLSHVPSRCFRYHTARFRTANIWENCSREAFAAVSVGLVVAKLSPSFRELDFSFRGRHPAWAQVKPST